MMLIQGVDDTFDSRMDLQRNPVMANQQKHKVAKCLQLCVYTVEIASSKIKIPFISLNCEKYEEA